MRTRISLAAATAVFALLLAGTAVAGGWATVRLSSQPTALSAGEAWVVDVTVLQHGETPIDGASPAVTIRKNGPRTTSSAPARTFRARPTGLTGVYRVRVVFPSAGSWRVAVYDGFEEYDGARTHRYPAVKIMPARS